jgi:hypothetical protein
VLKQAPVISRLLLFFLALLLLAGAGACKKKGEDAAPAVAAGAGRDDAGARGAARGERVVLEGVVIRTVEPERVVDVQEDDLARELGATLTASEWFFAAASEVPEGFHARPAVLEVTLHYDVVEEGTQGGRALMAAVEAEVRWRDGAGDDITVRENLLAEQPLAAEEPGPPSDGRIVEHVARSVRAIADGILAKEALRQSGPEELRAALESGEIDLALFALQVIGERGHRDALDRVAALLEAPDPRLRDGAVGTLVALRDPRGVHPLTANADFSDYQALRVLIEAVSAIGGDDAEEFLEFVASGHPDDDIKERASEGLERARRSR